jgi:hypothetical protein
MNLLCTTALLSALLFHPGSSAAANQFSDEQMNGGNITFQDFMDNPATGNLAMMECNE